MAAQIGPNLNLNHSWSAGEDGWNVGMDENLIKLDTLQHLSVKSKSVATPPVSPTAGDRYIIASNPTGVWATFTDYITVYINSVWQMYTPKIGFIAYIEDLNVLNIYANSVWINIHPAGDGNLHVPANSTTNSGKVLTAGASAGLYTWEPASGGGLDWELVTINTTAVKDKGYLINATSNNVTILLPVAPVEGDSVGVCDVYNKATTNVITVDRNTHNIEGVAENLIVDINGAGFIFVYVDVTRGWEIISEIGTNSGLITNTITNGDLTHAPDGNSIFDALALKAPLSGATLTGATINSVTPTAISIGFTIAGGSTSKTLTVPLDASVSGTNTGDQNLSGYASLADVIALTIALGG